jgi:hypothetical protein
MLTSARQHLARKHMVSYRCPRCWISFDTQRGVADHRDKGGCIEKHKPDDECFIDPWHEAQVKTAYSSTSEEETWWSLFRLLVSSVQGLDEATLKAQYWPCKSQTPFFSRRQHIRGPGFDMALPYNSRLCSLRHVPSNSCPDIFGRLVPGPRNVISERNYHIQQAYMVPPPEKQQ